jgi:hypothetical protein
MTDVSGLLAATLKDADDPSVSVSVVARKALRIARLRNDWEAQWWLQLEMATIDEGNPHQDDVKHASMDVAQHMTTEDYNALGLRLVSEWLHGPRAVDGDKFLPLGITDSEVRLDAIEAQMRALPPPALCQSLSQFGAGQGRDATQSRGFACAWGSRPTAQPHCALPFDC